MLVNQPAPFLSITTSLSFSLLSQFSLVLRNNVNKWVWFCFIFTCSFFFFSAFPSLLYLIYFQVLYLYKRFRFLFLYVGYIVFIGIFLFLFFPYLGSFCWSVLVKFWHKLSCIFIIINGLGMAPISLFFCRPPWFLPGQQVLQDCTFFVPFLIQKYMVLAFICRIKWVVRCFDIDDLSKESMFDQSQIRKFIKLSMLSIVFVACLLRSNCFCRE